MHDEQRADRDFPWPPPEHDAIGGFFATWRRSVVSPAAFFRAMPADGSVGAALVYFLIVGIAAAGISLFWQVTLIPALASDDASPFAALVFAPDDSPLLSFLLSPLYLLLTFAIATVFLHFSLWVVGGARQRMGTTARVVAFSYGPQLFVIVPLLGILIASLWSLWLSIVGLREAHGVETWRAAVAVLLPVFALIALMVLLFIVLLASGASMLPGVLGPGPG